MVALVKMLLRSALSVAVAADLALKLVRLLNQHGISAFWVSEEEGRQLAEVWMVGAWIRAN